MSNENPSVKDVYELTKEIKENHLKHIEAHTKPLKRFDWWMAALLAVLLFIGG